ncbi:MAG: hypothetical protein A2265_10575 [Bacteroidetes bacterium RIFOXYA12_FULL_33_9]|nr:MAG: hypothetical protein A2265_10575 [Bacteroidetes bacterium RIFOXYA12_FULL_33_9]
MFVFSCTKIRESRIEGTWEYIPLTYDASVDEFWTFTENDELIVKRIYNSSITTTHDTGTFHIKAEGLSGYVEVFDIDKYTNGKYRIKKVTNKQLKILRILDGEGNSEYVLREFIKSSE